MQKKILVHKSTVRVFEGFPLHRKKRDIPQFCGQARFLISKRMDTDLFRFEQLLLRDHLHTCYGCRCYLRDLQEVRTEISVYVAGSEEARRPFGLSLDARERIKTALQKAFKNTHGPIRLRPLPKSRIQSAHLRRGISS